jgi:hypothetical protein
MITDKTRAYTLRCACRCYLAYLLCAWLEASANAFNLRNLNHLTTYLIFAIISNITRAPGPEVARNSSRFDSVRGLEIVLDLIPPIAVSSHSIWG